MAPQSKRPDISTFADHEVISPPNGLAKAIARGAAGNAEDDLVARAEQALSMLSSEFTTWMDDESERLHVARRALKATGIERDGLQVLYHASHDIKGEAATFGYPLVVPAAESLCRIVEQAPDASRIPFELVDQHVSAIRAIIREYARPDIETLATDLAQRLRLLSDDFLALEGIKSPPIAPQA